MQARVRLVQARGYAMGSWFKKDGGDGNENNGNDGPAGSGPKITPEHMEKFAQSELMQSLMKHPECMEALAKTQQMMVDKGYIVPGEAPSIMTQARMLADSDLREQLVKSTSLCVLTYLVVVLTAVKETWDTAGIQITQKEYVHTPMCL